MFQCRFKGTLAKVFAAGPDPIAYEHNKMAVYCHNLNGLIQDVTLGSFVDGDSLTPIADKMSRVLFYSAGHALANIIHRQQSQVKEDILSGKISGPNKGINVIVVPLLQENATLSNVMHTVNNQYKTMVKAWSTPKEEEQLQSQRPTTSTISTHDAGNDLPPPLGLNVDDQETVENLWLMLNPMTSRQMP